MANHFLPEKLIYAINITVICSYNNCDPILSMYAHFSNSILLDFHYLQRQMNGLTKLQPFKLSYHGDTALDS